MAILGAPLSFRSSLPVKLALVALLFIGTIVAVRLLSLGRLALVGATSAEVQNRWLDSVRPLDHLHDLTSDVRAAEAALLLAQGGLQPAGRASEFPNLVQKTEEAIEHYRQRLKAPNETAIFNDFIWRWNQYLRQADIVRAFSQSGNPSAAVAWFNGKSQSDFTAAVTVLEQ